MSRFLLPAALLAAAAPAVGKVAPLPTPVQRALAADTVVVGKVTAIEADPVEVAGRDGAPAVKYTVAVIKVDTALVGAAGLTHLKVGFVPGPPAQGSVGPRPRGYGPIGLTASETIDAARGVFNGWLIEAQRDPRQAGAAPFRPGR